MLFLGVWSLSNSQGWASLLYPVPLEQTSKHQVFLAHVPVT